MMNKIYSIKDSFAALVVMVLNQSIEVTVGLHRLEERGFLISRQIFLKDSSVQLCDRVDIQIQFGCVAPSEMLFYRPWL